MKTLEINTDNNIAYYAVVNIRGDRITKIYDVFKNWKETYYLVNDLCHSFAASPKYEEKDGESAYRYYKKDGKEIHYIRDAGLPQILLVDAKNEEHAKLKIMNGLFEIHPVYEFSYPTWC